MCLDQLLVLIILILNFYYIATGQKVCKRNRRGSATL